jgi:hypothetical protein
MFEVWEEMNEMVPRNECFCQVNEKLSRFKNVLPSLPIEHYY